MKWVGHVARIGNMTSVYKILLILKGMLNKSLVRMMAGFSKLRVQSSLCALLKNGMVLWVPYKASLGIIIFSR
jgi:hypothetical protein